MEENQLIKKLNRNLEHARNSKLYSKKYENVNLNIKSLKDFKKIPFTTKEDLKEYYPYGNLSINIDEVIEMHTSSGTTGEPQVTFLTKEDLEIASNAVSEAWSEFGITKKSVVQFIMSYGLFSGAMLNTFAIQKLGALVIPSGIVHTKQQVDLMQKFKVDTIVATPSYYFYLHDYLKKNNIDISTLNLKRGIAAGEVYSEETRRDIEERFNIKIFDHYGLCEVYTGIAYECAKKEGLHILSEYIYAEVVDPDTGVEVKTGEIGELILTTLQKKASPLIRYKTSDIVRKLDKCSCGKDSFFISRILKRKDDVIFIKGIKLDPNEVKLSLNNVLKDNFYSEIQFVIPKDLSFNYPKILMVPKKENINIEDIKKIVKAETNLNFEIEFVNINYFRNNYQTKIKLIKYI